MNTRGKMRRSNAKVKKWMIDNGYDCIYFMPHIRYPYEQIVDCKKIIGLDIFNLFDGIVLKDTELYFIQISTNRFHPIKPYQEFCNKHKIKIILFNVKNKKGISIKSVSPP